LNEAKAGESSYASAKHSLKKFWEGFGVDYGHLYRRFHMAQKKAGFEKRIRFHDCRHTFASQFMMNARFHTPLGLKTRDTHLKKCLDHLEAYSKESASRVYLTGARNRS
jgi:integrase